MKKLKKNKKGFTLVELMIVIVIMVILAAAAAPIFSGYMKKARATKHLADCRSIYVAAQTFIEEKRASEKEVVEGDKGALEEEIISLAGRPEADVEASIQTAAFAADATFSASTTTDIVYTVYIGDNECAAVVYNGEDDGIWVFNTSDGTFLETK